MKEGISKLLDSSMIHCYKLCSTMSPPFSSSIKKTFIVSLRISSYISYLQVAFSLIVKLCFDVLSLNHFHHYDFGSRLASSTDYFVRFPLLDFFFSFLYVSRESVLSGLCVCSSTMARILSGSVSLF